MPAGRPRKANRKALAKAMEQYIEETEIPIIAEFAWKNNVLRESLYDWPEFSTLLKACTTKKEAELERLASQGKINVTMAIFSLKQLGWSDKQELKHSGQLVQINGELAKV